MKQTVRLEDPYYLLTPIADGLGVVTWQPPTKHVKRRRYETWVLWRGMRLFATISPTLEVAESEHTNQCTYAQNYYGRIVQEHAELVDELLSAGWLDLEDNGDFDLSLRGYTAIKTVLDNPLINGTNYQTSAIKLAEA